MEGVGHLHPGRLLEGGNIAEVLVEAKHVFPLYVQEEPPVSPPRRGVKDQVVQTRLFAVSPSPSPCERLGRIRRCRDSFSGGPITTCQGRIRRCRQGGNMRARDSISPLSFPRSSDLQGVKATCVPQGGKVKRLEGQGHRSRRSTPSVLRKAARVGGQGHAPTAGLGPHALNRPSSMGQTDRACTLQQRGGVRGKGGGGGSPLGEVS